MPPSALDQLTRLNVEYPMLFKLTNSKKSRITHAGVLEFVADEGKIYIPYWVMVFSERTEIEKYDNIHSDYFISLLFDSDDAQFIAGRR